MLEGPDDMLVLRLWRWDRERLRTDAENDLQDQLANGVALPRPSISAFATSPRHSEDVEAMKTRLVGEATRHRSSEWAAFTTASALAKAGFRIEKNEPPPHHYDIVISDSNSDSELALLQELFEKNERVRI